VLRANWVESPAWGAVPLPPTRPQVPRGRVFHGDQITGVLGAGQLLEIVLGLGPTGFDPKTAEQFQRVFMVAVDGYGAPRGGFGFGRSAHEQKQCAQGGQEVGLIAAMQNCLLEMAAGGFQVTGKDRAFI